MIYFDNSATTRYKPPVVREAMSDALSGSANPGRSGHRAALAAATAVFEARQELMSSFGCSGNCVFTSGCTHALNLAIFGLIGRGHVLSTVTEHNSVLRPLFHLSNRGQIRVDLAAPDHDGLISTKTLSKMASPNTKLLILNAVSNVTGTAQPLAEIGAFCRSRGILFVVDGAQSAGYIDMDMTRDCIDVLALAPHKGLHGPMGVGALLLDGRVTTLSPLILGGTGIDSASTMPHSVIPEGLEAGTLPYPAILGLRAAQSWAMRYLLESAAHNLALTETLCDGLEKIPHVTVYSRPNASGVVSFNFDFLESSETADRLDEQGFCVRGGLHCAPKMHEFLGTLKGGAVRVSVGCDNTAEEIDRLLSFLKKI